MSDVVTVAIELAGLGSGLVVIAAWLFRRTSAPLALKLILPMLMLGCGLGSAWQFSSLLGRPASATLASMPEHLTLIAFMALENDAYVDLWVDEGGATRAYEIPLDGKTRAALRQARAALAEGRPVKLAKHGAPSTVHALTDPNGDDRQGFELDALQSSLPPKI